MLKKKLVLLRGDQTSAEAYLTVLPRAMECVVFSIDGSFAASVSIMGSDPKVRPGAVDVVRQVSGFWICASRFKPQTVLTSAVRTCADTGRTWDTWSFTSPAARTCRSNVWCPGSRSTTFPMGWSSSLKAWSTIPWDKRPSSLETSSRRYHKSECFYTDQAGFCEPTHNLVTVVLFEQCHIKIISAYGSMKDISVYNMLGLSPSQIYIVGRPSKKYQNQCQVVCSLSEFVINLIYFWLSVWSCFSFSLGSTFSSWAMAMQHISPPFSLDTEPDLRNRPLFAWFWGKDPLVSQQSQTSCVSAPTWEGPCQCSSRTRRARPTPSPSAPKASRSLTRITVLREQEVEEELVVVAGRWRGVGPPCSGETPLPDRKEAEGLVGEKGDERRFSMSRVKVRSAGFQNSNAVGPVCVPWGLPKCGSV